MNNSLRKANVYVKNIFAGELREVSEGYVFKYNETYLNSKKPYPVSLTLPLQKEEFFSTTLFSFFDGLIPEGWLLNKISNNWKIPLNDRFGLLLVSCKDTIGDVSVKRCEDE